MSDGWDKVNSDQEFSLEEILAEYGGRKGPEEEKTAPPELPEEDFGPDLPWPEAKKPKQNVVQFPGMTLVEEPEEEEPEEELPAEEPENLCREEAEDRVLQFPGSEEPTTPLEEVLELLRRRADEYAEHMFEEEGVEVSEETRRIERLIPGVDRESAPRRRIKRERPSRPEAEPLPDFSADELYQRFSGSLRGLRRRTAAAFFLAAVILYLAFAPLMGTPLPAAVAQGTLLSVYLSAGGLIVVMILGADVLAEGIWGLVRLKPGMDTLTAFSCIACLLDAVTMQTLGLRNGSLPYCGVAALGLAWAMLGTYKKQSGLSSTCRTAAAAAEPYLLTLDEDKWNGRSAYSKWTGPVHGFGSQIQEPDGAQRIFHVVTPLILLACFLFALLASFGQRAPERFLWSLSAILTAAASFSGMLCFALPFNVLAKRLSQVGAALAGWEGVRRSIRGNGLLLTDVDLFPPGAVKMNGIKVFGDFPIEKVVGITATMIRDSGSGLNKTFYDLLRTQGAVYRRSTNFQCYGGGGMSAEIRGEQVLVGTAAFMQLMEVALPQGLRVKNAVFCAIEGELAGIFALNYRLGGAISPALTALINNRVVPVLATRDFNIIPAMLRQKFKLPAEQMEFPAVERRWELSDSDQEHSETLTAVLCREGLGPVSDAVVGARRLRRAVRLSAALTVAGSVIGALLAFYLTFVTAYQSISVTNLTTFMLLWLVPTALISGWVNRY